MQIATFAAIDIGTYDVFLEIFEISRKQRIKSIDKIRHRIELGKDTYSDGKISPELEEELCAVLEDFVRIMDGYKVDAYRAVASSALREAQNSLFIIGKIRQLTGLEVTILSNSEQRFLSYKALATMETDFNKIIEKGTAIIDLDGGSTQVSLFDKDALVTTQNLRMGSVRIRERLSGIASETSHYETLVKEFIWNEMLSFKKMYLKDRKIENVMLLGDFFTNAIFQNEEERSSRIISRKTFRNWVQQISGHSPMELAVKFGVPLENASLMSPAAVICGTLVDMMDVQQIWIPGTHLARGLAYEYAEEKKLIKVKHSFENDILMAAKNIGKRYAVNRPHIQNIQMIAMEIFDSMKKIHGMGARERLLLQIAAMLHDVGKYISLNSPGQCTYHIIMSNEIIGLSHAEREMIALIGRYNTEYLPQYDQFAQAAAVSEEKYLKIAEMTAILRLANTLDRSHQQKVQQARAVLKERELTLYLTVNGDFTLEQGLCKDKMDFFYEVFSVRPILKVKRQL